MAIFVLCARIGQHWGGTDGSLLRKRCPDPIWCCQQIKTDSEAEYAETTHWRWSSEAFSYIYFIHSLTKRFVACFSDWYKMRRSTYHSEYNTKTNYWRPKSTIWRVSVASAHSHRRLSVRWCPRFAVFHCNGSALHWTGTHEGHYRLFGWTWHPRFGHHRWTDAGRKAFREPQIYPSKI